MTDKKPYLKHPADKLSDQRFISLWNRWKWKGYGLYWAIKELLRLAPTYELFKNYKDLAKFLKTSEKVLKSVIEDFDIFEISDNTFYCVDLKEEMELMKIKSEKGRKSAEERWKRERERLLKNKRNSGIEELGSILKSFTDANA